MQSHWWRQWQRRQHGFMSTRTFIATNFDCNAIMYRHAHFQLKCHDALHSLKKRSIFSLLFFSRMCTISTFQERKKADYADNVSQEKKTSIKFTHEDGIEAEFFFPRMSNCTQTQNWTDQSAAMYLDFGVICFCWGVHRKELLVVAMTHGKQSTYSPYDQHNDICHGRYEQYGIYLSIHSKTLCSCKRSKDKMSSYEMHACVLPIWPACMIANGLPILFSERVPNLQIVQALRNFQTGQLISKSGKPVKKCLRILWGDDVTCLYQWKFEYMHPS